LVVDDDPGIITLLQASLEDEGWEILSALDGEEAIRVINTRLPTLVILDINLPKISGLEVCRRTSSDTSIPVIMLSGINDTGTKIQCLSMGAEDYVTKPFKVEELIARIKLVLRRNHLGRTMPSGTCFKYDGLEVDFCSQRVSVVGKEVRLTPTEFNILQELIANSGKVLSHKHLLNAIWGTKYGMENAYLHVYLSRLRAKLEPDPSKPRYIINIHGVGYIFQKSL
jgi:two-component system KDP operon response regulator KdpE